LRHRGELDVKFSSRFSLALEVVGDQHQASAALRPSRSPLTIIIIIIIITSQFCEILLRILAFKAETS